MRFSALALSTLAAQATARAVGANVPRGVDYSNVDYSNVDWSRIDWSKVDFGFGGHHGGNDDNNDAPAAPAPAPAAPAPVPQPEQVERPNPQPTVVVVESEPEPEAPAPEAPAPVATQVAEVQQEEPVQEEETAPSSGSGGMSADQKAALDAHNAARSAVGNSALSWDASLAADAQSWANTIAAKGALEHASVDGQGENLYMQSGSSAPYKNGINAFLSEKSLYNGEKIDSSNYMSFGHYTQAVWKSTTKVGMALAEAADGATYVVYRYSPPGNYMGELPF